MELFQLLTAVRSLENGIYPGRVISGFQPYTFHSKVIAGGYSLPTYTENIVYVVFSKMAQQYSVLANGVELLMIAAPNTQIVVFERVLGDVSNDVNSVPFQCFGFKVIIPGHGATVPPAPPGGFLMFDDTGNNFITYNDLGGSFIKV